ncbi:MAG: HD domain-containing protein [Thermoanaerobaculaceae bacterium]|nr:HD domain-containing protein [Thermoanaerobaculaceae bacterium]MDI9620554.1 HD domain-containing protein [Acidobacteriota bacterium]NLH11925.1 HD domain-containing protein [Holophagae bacterium]HPW55207.1 HD domain-containing protein [Thermoanaerobaculaceae bacterium]
MDERLGRQIGFLQEVDRLKGVLRRSYVLAGERRENAAEHCWHVALAAVVLAEHAAEPVDVGRVVTMLLVHDLVEIDAGDTFVYDRAAQNDKRERERAAADRVFGLLPDDLGSGLRALWEEFEARLSPEARFAAALDRLLPLHHNLWCHGKSWQEHGIRLGQVLEVNRHMAEGAPALWAHAEAAVEQAARDGLLAAE